MNHVKKKWPSYIWLLVGLYAVFSTLFIHTEPTTAASIWLDENSAWFDPLIILLGVVMISESIYSIFIRKDEDNDPRIAFWKTDNKTQAIQRFVSVVLLFAAMTSVFWLFPLIGPWSFLAMFLLVVISVAVHPSTLKISRV